MGANVIAADIDESSIDNLYLAAKEPQLNILPARLHFADLTREIYSPCAPPGSGPLFLSAVQRLRSEVVLCLGLIHHLVLGQNMSIEGVLSILSDLTSKALILEFINLDDELIASEPNYFDSLSCYRPETYNLDLVVKTASSKFPNCKVVDSHPASRKLLILEK